MMERNTLLCQGLKNCLWDPVKPFQVYDLNGIEMEGGLPYGAKRSEQSFPMTLKKKDFIY